MILDLGPMKRAHKGLLGQVEAIGRTTLRDIARDTVADVKRNPRGFKHRTGALKRSLKRRFIRTSSGRIVEVAAHADHAKPLSSGSRPHAIPNAFGRGFTVLHPGTKPTLFLKRAAEAMSGRHEAAWERQMEDAAERFNRAR